MINVEPKKYLFTLRKNDEGKFLHTSKNQNAEGRLAKYLLADCKDPDAASAFGEQTRRIVKPIFEGTMTFDELKNALETGIIDKDSGVSSKPLSGYFVDIPVGFEYETEFNGRKFRSSTVSLFVMKGENFDVVKNRAIRSVQHLKVQTSDDIEAKTEQELSQQENAPKPSNDDF